MSDLDFRGGRWSLLLEGDYDAGACFWGGDMVPEPAIWVDKMLEPAFRRTGC